MGGPGNNAFSVRRVNSLSAFSLNSASASAHVPGFKSFPRGWGTAPCPFPRWEGASLQCRGPGRPGYRRGAFIPGERFVLPGSFPHAPALFRQPHAGWRGTEVRVREDRLPGGRVGPVC